MLLRTLCTEQTVSDLGLNWWHDSGKDGVKPQVDIVLVQGLEAHPFYTWTGRPKSSSSPPPNKSTWKRKLPFGKSHHETKAATAAEPGQATSTFFWPRDLLPPSLPPCTIATYSYPSSGWSSKEIRTDLRTCGEQFLNILQHDRQTTEAEGRPLILIGHSLGGLVIQQALVVANHGDDYKDVRTSLGGLIFLGSPIQGCTLASFGDWIQSVAGRDKQLLHSLRSGSQELLSLSRDFWNAFGRLPITCFFENRSSNYGGYHIKTVNSQSATFIGKRRLYLDADHTHLNKFTGPEDKNFKIFLPVLFAAVKSAILPKPDESTARCQWFMPFDRDLNFVTRGSIINQLDTMFAERRSQSRAALCGLGGVGKSQIAIEYAYTRRERCPNTSIFWIHASRPDRLRAGYLAICQQLCLPHSDDPQTDVLDLLYRWLLSEASGDWLLILDNVDDINFVTPDHAQAHEFLISKYLPQRAGGDILITSRDRQVAFALVSRPESVIVIPCMTPDEARSLVDVRIPEGKGENTERDLLSSQLDYVPLAITQAAAYINKGERMTITKYLDIFASTESDAVLMLTKEGADLRRDHDVHNSVIRTWEISFAHIQSLMPTSIDLLSCMALLDRSGIPEFLLRQDRNDLEFEEAIEKLLGFAMVTLDEYRTTLSIHQLVQLATRQWLRSRNLLTHQYGEVLKMISRCYPVSNFNKWSTCQILEPHAAVALQPNYSTDELELVLADVLHKRSLFHHDQGKYTLAEQFCEFSFKIRKRVLSREHSKTLTSMNNLALIYLDQGRHSEAEKMKVHVLEAKRRTLGEEHSDTLRCMNNLATIYSAQGRHSEAEKMKVHVLEVRRRVLGEEHPSTLTSMNNLATTYSDQGRHSEAEKLKVHVLEVRRRVLGEEHPDTLTSMNNLAETYSAQGRHGEAETIQADTLEGRRRVLGEEHPHTLTSMNNLARTHFEQGRIDVAEALMMQVVLLSKQVLGEEHPITLVYVDHLNYIQQSRMLGNG